MSLFDPKSLKLIGELTKDVNKLKEFLNLAEMAPSIFLAFEDAHPLEDDEEKAVMFIQSDDYGDLFVSAATLDGNGVPVRVLFHWEFLDVLNRLNLAELMDKKELLASGQLNWAQIKEILKIKQQNG